MKQYKFEAVIKKVVEETVTVVVEAETYDVATDIVENFLERHPDEPVSFEYAPIRYRVNAQDINHKDIVSIREVSSA